MSDEQAAQNTDRELWREREGDYYADSLLVTKEGAIGMNCGGSVFVKPIREWHRLARIDAHCGNCLDPKCLGCEGKRNQVSGPLAQQASGSTGPSDKLIRRMVKVLDARNTPKSADHHDSPEKMGYESFLSETARVLYGIAHSEEV